MSVEDVVAGSNGKNGLSDREKQIIILLLESQLKKKKKKDVDENRPTDRPDKA